MKILISVASIGMSPEDAAAYSSARQEYASFYSRLDNDAKRALNSYGSSEAWEYNEHLRQNKGSVKPGFRYGYMHEPLLRALSHRSRKEHIVFRGDKQLFGQVSSGTRILKHDPTSATFNPAVAIEFGTAGSRIYLTKIIVTKGTMFGIPQNNFEAELILKQGTMFKVEREDKYTDRGKEYHVVTVRTVPTVRNMKEPHGTQDTAAAPPARHL